MSRLMTHMKIQPANPAFYGAELASDVNNARRAIPSIRKEPPAVVALQMTKLSLKLAGKDSSLRAAVRAIRASND